MQPGSADIYVYCIMCARVEWILVFTFCHYPSPSLHLFPLHPLPFHPISSPSPLHPKDTTQNVAGVDSPDGATSLQRSDETPSLTQAPLTSEVPQSPPGVTVSREEEEVRSLREALRSSEDQVQLIHSEYRSICREKDDTIRSLKAALEQTGEHQRGEVHQN